jgi:hypothetical protein
LTEVTRGSKIGKRDGARPTAGLGRLRTRNELEPDRRTIRTLPKPKKGAGLMARVLLLDFDDTDKSRLAAEKYDVELRSTGWRSGTESALEIPADSEVIFYQLERYGADGRSQLHADVHEALLRRVEAGARVVCFIGGGELYQLTNIIGDIPQLQFQDNARAESILFNPRALFHVPFERFRPFIAKAFKLLPAAPGEGVWEGPGPAGKLEFMAKSTDGFPVALLAGRGKGYLLLLPSFGPKNVEVIDYLLKDKMPLAAAAAAPETPVESWIDDDDFVFPELKALLARKDEETRRHERALGELDRLIAEAKAGGQEEFHKLLTSEGAELVRAVVHTLRYLGWGRVVDVDEYWKKVIRSREENVWLIEAAGPSVEASLRKEELVLVLVRAGKAWAADDECALLQKYKGRRMQEFDNTKMKALLIGNYFSAADPRSRGSPFSALQVEEATKDGNGLLTTWELFRAVKAEKDGRVAKAAIRAQVRQKTGLITFEY